MTTLEETCGNLLVTRLVKNGKGRRTFVKTKHDNCVINPLSQSQLNDYGNLRSMMNKATREDALTRRLLADFNARVDLTCYGMPLTVMLEKGRTNMFVATLIFKLLAQWTEPVERAFQEVLVFRKRLLLENN